VYSTPEEIAEEYADLAQRLQRIADLAQVPVGRRRKKLISAACDLIGEALIRFCARHLHSNPKYMKANDVKVARTKALELRDALRPLEDIVDTAAIDGLVAESSILAGANPEPAAGGKRGRRKGSGGDWTFKWLVGELLYVVRAAGGDLTLSKLDNTPRGTLIEALDLLRPYVDCIPSMPPYRTLQRLHALRSAAQRPVSAVPTLRWIRPGGQAGPLGQAAIRQYVRRLKAEVFQRIPTNPSSD
jgi:hypothetical protein